MAASSRPFRRFAACIVVVLCAGAAAWVCNRESCEALWTIVSSASSDAMPERQGERIREQQSPLEVTAVISTGERPVELSPQEKLNARVEAALEEARPMEGGPGVSAELTVSESQPEKKAQDSVVTEAFVHDLAFWLASSYVPARGEGRGASTVTLKRANFRYSSSGTLRSSESDTVKARSAILRHVCSPGMLEVLYRLYSPVFLEELEKAARLPRKSGTLSDAQTADLFRVYAGFLRRTSTALEAASRTDVKGLASAIRRAAVSEDAANDTFAKAYTALAAARESGDLAQAARQSERMAQSARAAGIHDEQEQRARRTMAAAIRAKAGGPTLSDEDLIFLGEWLARHGCSSATASAAASVCSRMAREMAARAESLTQAVPVPAAPETIALHPQASPEPVETVPAALPVPVTVVAPLTTVQPSLPLSAPVLPKAAGGEAQPR